MRKELRLEDFPNCYFCRVYLEQREKGLLTEVEREDLERRVRKHLQAHVESQRFSAQFKSSLRRD